MLSKTNVEDDEKGAMDVLRLTRHRIIQEPPLHLRSSDSEVLEWKEKNMRGSVLW